MSDAIRDDPETSQAATAIYSPLMFEFPMFFSGSSSSADATSVDTKSLLPMSMLLESGS
jgi:hypothetical protein